MEFPLIIQKNKLYPIALIGLIFTLFTITIDLTSLGVPKEFGSVFPVLGLAATFITVVVLIVDVFKNNFSSKYLWTLGFLLTGCIAGLYYLMNREKLMAGK
ncbi:hypothetical protein MTP09_12220 [Chryseobacterium suipulveris]|uniref:Uncharacterized protein n=1 Tax=Chryseobacterium suipulveris TaxID=2929800 RepID=A0ABY4BN83_9FLAO|nr:hypothetical protein [Chryseobacterium suipulveris]UOE40656.1 hypothetical protein MTP09_12220 [Chryseobacterium suipulveris]